MMAEFNGFDFKSNENVAMDEVSIQWILKDVQSMLIIVQ
jgi:hypothetical protein